MRHVLPRKRYTARIGKRRLTAKPEVTKNTVFRYAVEATGLTGIYLYSAGLAYAHAYFATVGLGHLAIDIPTYHLIALSMFLVSSMSGLVLLGSATIVALLGVWLTRHSAKIRAVMVLIIALCLFPATAIVANGEGRSDVREVIAVPIDEIRVHVKSAAAQDYSVDLFQPNEARPIGLLFETKEYYYVFRQPPDWRSFRPGDDYSHVHVYELPVSDVWIEHRPPYSH